MYDERFARMWEFYLISAEAMFRTGSQLVFHMQLSRTRDAAPLQRDYMVDVQRDYEKREIERKVTAVSKRLMMSQTHVLVASALLARPGKATPQHGRAGRCLRAGRRDLRAVLVVQSWQAFPRRQVWSEIYWNPPWSEWVAAGNSIFIYGALLIVGFVLLRAVPAAFRIGLFLTFLALAAFTHLAGDFPVHVADAHRHLWPFSNWTFQSPVSYWDRNHHGGLFSLFEATLGLVLCVMLWRRFHAWWVRLALLLLFVPISLFRLISSRSGRRIAMLTYDDFPVGRSFSPRSAHRHGGRNHQPSPNSSTRNRSISTRMHRKPK